MTKNLTYNLTSGSLPTGLTLNENTGVIRGVPTASYTPGGVASTFTVTATDGVNSAPRTFNITRKWRDGSTSDLAGVSAEAIKAETGINTDGAYFINLPVIGPTSLYCRMDNNYGGGGWIMAMKATRGNTFPYASNYWNTNNTLNTGQTNSSDGDAKFEAFNVYPTAEIMCVWPDVPATTNSGTGGAYGTATGVWTWEQSLDFVLRQSREQTTSPRTTLLDLFFRNQEQTITNGVNGSNVRNWIGKGGNTGPFSSQGGFNWYGFNYQTNGSNRVRWGFAWNNENDQNTNDSGGGIGLQGSSGGDYAGAQDYTGINRTARWELYVR
jgi:hypothetical protein